MGEVKNTEDIGKNNPSYSRDNQENIPFVEAVPIEQKKKLSEYHPTAEAREFRQGDPEVGLTRTVRIMRMITPDGTVIIERRSRGVRPLTSRLVEPYSRSQHPNGQTEYDRNGNEIAAGRNRVNRISLGLIREESAGDLQELQTSATRETQNNPAPQRPSFLSRLLSGCRSNDAVDPNAHEPNGRGGR